MIHRPFITAVAAVLALLIVTAPDIEAKQKGKFLMFPEKKVQLSREQVTGLWFIRKISDDSTVAPFTFNPDGTCRISDGISETVWTWTVKKDTVTCTAGKGGKPVYLWKYDAATGALNSEIYQGKPYKGYRLVKPE